MVRTHQASTPEYDQEPSQTLPAPVRLVDCIGDEHKDQSDGITFSFPDYLELVDWTGRAIRDDKTGLFPIPCSPYWPDWGLNNKAGWT